MYSHFCTSVVYFLIHDPALSVCHVRKSLLFEPCVATIMIISFGIHSLCSYYLDSIVSLHVLVNLNSWCKIGVLNFLIWDECVSES